MAKSNLNNTLLAVIPLLSITADASVPAFRAPRAGRIKSLSIMNGATIAASDTDYFILQLKKGSAVIATFDSRAAHQNGLTALLGKLATLDDTGGVADATGALDFAEGDNLTLAYDESGTMALTNATVAIELRLE